MVAASQQLQITSMALGHLVGFNQEQLVLQLVTGLRSMPCLASLVALFADWPGDAVAGRPSWEKLQQVWNAHSRVGWIRAERKVLFQCH